MEAKMAKLYTKFMFEKFQVEKMKSFLREKSRDGNVALYEVLERIGWMTKTKALVIDTVLGYAKCSCKGKGIMCSSNGALCG
ncbi:protein FAR1-RELATED SEQUENCE 5-like [Pyrus ussuriensis x Pyrus communis]|uniref:Protein FAR1-RELATED SEQUENCE 5-like n=1 Tax=Pyrus ussuriensis x Pyrus communis TaxID=2448454 RepID=A0A5N5G8L6_9ROSA|nr:protein FAR1-RELATED SEQUENCE 5-like [Pyrus ussuriensis x Pyrus communis]